MRTLFFVVFGGLALAGCNSVEKASRTVISYERHGQDVAFRIETPKDNQVKDFDLIRDPATGEVRVKWAELTASVNAGAVNAAVAEQQTRTQLVGLLAQTTAAALGRGVVTVPAQAGREPRDAPTQPP
jgi:hypothetical protein